MLGGSGLPSGTPLLDLSAGAFGRTEEGGYVSAADDVDWFGVDVRRTGPFGTLIERQHVCYSANGTYLSTGYTGLNGTTLVVGSAAAGTAPDGTTPARITFSATPIGMIQGTIGAGTIANGTILAFDLFVRGAAGGEALRFQVTGKDGVATDLDFAATTSWQWLTMIKDVGTGGAGVQVRLRNRTGAAGFVADAWICQNVSRYPYSPNRTTTAPKTLGADVLTFLAAQVPAWLREKSSLWVLTPQWAPADLVSGNLGWLFTIGAGATDGLRWRHNGVDVRIESVVGGVVRASSPAVTGSTRRVARAVRVEPVAGLVYVNGVPGAAGTPWAWPGGLDLCFGGAFNANEVDGFMPAPVVP